jgi:alpha-galactosidase
VRFEVLRHFDFFVTESSAHMSEYVPYFRQTPERRAEFRLESREMDLGRRREWDESYARRLREDIEAEALPLKPSTEYAAGIIHALTTGVPFVLNASVLNQGIITNLPEGCAVEVPCVVDRTGVHPCHVGPLPPQLAALNRSNIALQELTVQAILNHDTRAAFHAMLLDPLTAGRLSLKEARGMFDEMMNDERWMMN